MKRLHEYIRVLLTMTLLLVLSTSLMGQPRQRPLHRARPAGNAPHFLPGLTDEQKSQMKEIHLDAIKEIQPLKDELKVNKARLNSLVRKENPDMDEIKSLVNENSDTQTRIRILAIESRIRIRNILTDEQKILFDNRLERRRKARYNRGYISQRPFHERGYRYPQRDRFQF